MKTQLMKVSKSELGEKESRPPKAELEIMNHINQEIAKAISIRQLRRSKGTRQERKLRLLGIIAAQLIQGESLPWWKWLLLRLAARKSASDQFLPLPTAIPLPRHLWTLKKSPQETGQ